MLYWAPDFLRRRRVAPEAVHELVIATWRDGFAAGWKRRGELLVERLGLVDDSEAAAELASAELVAAAWRGPIPADVDDEVDDEQDAEIPRDRVGRFRTRRAEKRK